MYLEKKIFLLVAAVIFGLFLTSAAPAAEPPNLQELEQKITQGASVSDLVSYAYQSNSSIKAARQGWKAVVERYRTETAYPDPELGFTTYPKPLMALYEVMISQAIPFPGKLSKSGETIEADIQMARLEVDKALRDVIVGVRESYHELLYIKEAKKVVALTQDLLAHLRKLGETAYARDRATFFDVVKAQSQQAQLEYDALLLEDLEQTEKVQLNSLLNRPPASDIKLLDGQSLLPLRYKLPEIYELVGKYQEEVRLAETQVQKARTKVSLAKYENLPGFRVGVSYARGNPDMVLPEFRDSVGVQFGVSIPLWFDKNTGRLEEARAEEQRALSMKATQINQAQAQVRSLYFRVQNADRLVRLYRDNLLPQATRSLEVAETWFREKEGSFSDLVETQATYYNFQLSLARARADYGKYLAQLERLVARSLTEREEPGEKAGEEKPR